MKRAVTALVMAMTMALTGCAGTNGGKAGTEKKVEIKKGNYNSEASIHDPQILLDSEGTYWMVGSHYLEAESGDLEKWTYTSKTPTVLFSNIYDGDMPAFDYVGKNDQGTYSCWAENIIYNDTMKKYVMYFCTTSTYIKSDICMAVADSPKGPWEYKAKFLYSGWTKKDVKNTDMYDVLGENADLSRYLQYGAYNNKQWPNSIDPAVFTDMDGRMWLVYGSWSGGIFLIELDKATGLPVSPKETGEGIDPYYGYRLLGGGHHAIEAPYIVYDSETKYYYLFLSYGELKREGGYQMREFRSKTPTGPYVDAKGQTPADQDDFFNYGVKLMGNYTFPSLETAYMAPGGESVFKDKNGDWCLVYHQRFDNGSEDFQDRIHRLYMTPEGWLVPQPFELSDDKVKNKGYQDDDLDGDVYMIDHGLSVDSNINEAEKTAFHKEKITGAYKGTYEIKKGTNQVVLKINGGVYTGVITDTTDEAGNKIRTILAVGDNNQTIWGVKYL
ncbi:MAG: glycoside hydrolase family 43 protein [Lachnospiraceae bacterium]|nr:glycoside hydrolase family 43 protein [Lachnospiraceae bacterium]MDD7665044.1 glycoside hydrolase family 43 protein [Lachnospiraceae bacterium]MDY4165477.1 glycoside hydrolase family 43 protein [Lachnospiraceae bacterium]